MLKQFPIIGLLNERRHDNFKIYRKDLCDTDKRIKSWIFHKCLSIISLPANLLAIGIGTILTITCACTIGAFKVAIFAISLGKIKPKISTGISWFGDRTIESIGEIFLIFFEIGRDIYSFCAKCIKIVKHILKALGFEALWLKIRKVVVQVFIFIKTRFKRGFKKACKVETNFILKEKSLPIITPLNAIRKKFESEWGEYNKRSFMDIFAHTALSIFTLPFNAIVFICSVVITCILFAAFLSKVLVYAITNINLPFPTFVRLSSEVTFRTYRLLFGNAASCIIDIPVTLYKVSKATGLFKVMAKIKDVVFYIPEALFEKV